MTCEYFIEQLEDFNLGNAAKFTVKSMEFLWLRDER